MESMIDFEKENIWYSEQQQRWMFIDKKFKRKGQALKACRKEWMRRKRLNLHMVVLYK